MGKGNISTGPCSIAILTQPEGISVFVMRCNIGYRSYFIPFIAVSWVMTETSHIDWRKKNKKRWEHVGVNQRQYGFHQQEMEPKTVS